MGLLVEPKLARVFIVEDKIEAVPFIIRIKGVSSLPKTKSLYSIAIDSSWSMDGIKMFRAKEAVIQILKKLNPDDLITVYSFNDKIIKIVYMVNASNYESIANYIADIKLGGGTNIYRLLQQMYKDVQGLDRNKVDSFKFVMVTDGMPTTGVRDPDKIIDLSKKLGKYASVSLIIGVGNDYNEKLLMNIAMNTNGFFEHLDDPSKLLSTLEKMVLKYRELSAKNVKLFIKTSPGASLYIYNRPAYAVKGGLEVDVGDIYAGDVVDIVGEVILPPQKKGLVHIVSVSTNYTDEKGNSLETPAVTTSLPCLSKPSIEHLEMDEKLFSEFNVVKMASILAKDMYGRASVIEIEKIINELVNTTLALERKELYSRTIDIKTHLEQEGLSPEVVKKILSLISKIVSGRLE